MKRRHFLHVAGGALTATALGCARRGDGPSPAPLPPYIGSHLQRGLFKAPYLQQDAHILVFLLAADRQRLRDLCDTKLNALGTEAARTAPGFDYAPLAPYVLMLYATMKISSLDAQDRALGWMRETEISFWVPTVARAKSGGLLVPDHVAFFVPYLFVDNPYALLAGREVYGFPKTLGQIQGVADYDAPAFTLDVWGFERFGPDEEGKVRRLLALRSTQPADDARPRAAAPWRSWGEARRALIHLLLDDGGHDPDGTTTSLLHALDQAEIPLVFLKQFPAVTDSARACYQALVEAPARVVEFHAGHRLAGDYRLVLQDLASHPLARTLGLSGSDPATDGLRPLAAFNVWTDFTLDHGGERWRTTQ
jgi:hypothetical protein